MFQGSYGYVTKCMECQKQTLNPSHFFDLSLKTEGCKSFEESMKDYLAVEKLTDSNQILCTHCQVKRNCERSIQITSLPLHLNLQLVRYTFDRETFQKKKITVVEAFTASEEAFTKRSEKFYTDIQERTFQWRQRKELWKEIVKNLKVLEDDEKYYWIDTTWLKDWIYGIENGPIDNCTLVCPHDGLTPVNLVNMKRIRAVVWDVLFSYHGGSPVLSNESYCNQCLFQLCNTSKQKTDSEVLKEEVIENELKEKKRKNGFIVSKFWFNEWKKKSVTNEQMKEKPPTFDIECDHGNLSIYDSDRKIVSQETWTLIESLYPGIVEYSTDDAEECLECLAIERRASAKNSNIQKEKIGLKEFLTLMKDGLYKHPFSSGRYYLIWGDWCDVWHTYMTEDGDRPGEIDNQPLLCEHGGMVYHFVDLDSLKRELERDNTPVPFVIVTKEIWDLLVATYKNSGPIITLTNGELSVHPCQECHTKISKQQREKLLHFTQESIFIHHIGDKDDEKDEKYYQYPPKNRRYIPTFQQKLFINNGQALNKDFMMLNQYQIIPNQAIVMKETNDLDGFFVNDMDNTPKNEKRLFVHILLNLSNKTQNNQSTISLLTSVGYEDPILVGNFSGSHYEIGFAYGVMLAKESLENYHALFDSVLPSNLDQDAFDLFLDWQWAEFLSKQMPQEYLDEIRGFNDGASSIGLPDLGFIMSRTITVSSFPGDIGANIEDLLKNEIGMLFDLEQKTGLGAEQMAKLIQGFPDGRIKGMQCSHYSVWGSRTQDGAMYNARDLDWFVATGISKHKLISFYHPTNAISHVTVGFAGVLGALTGISSQGLFVAESDSDTNSVTFEGFAWTMRLRAVMEQSTTIAEALAFWQATNNTMGMNHMLSAAFDNVTHPAYALETMRDYTAYFPDNDPKEAYFYTDPQTHKSVQMGWPMPEAVWRTNSGFDQTIRDHQTFVTQPGDNTMVRYDLIRDTILYYESVSQPISDAQAINITSIAGDKNNTNFYSCEMQSEGSNVISAMFNARSGLMYTAFEEGFGSSRVCACCGTYVQVDLTAWFGSESVMAKQLSRSMDRPSTVSHNPSKNRR
eukprot:gene17413-20778_t